MKRPIRNCPAEITLRVIGGTWKVPIVFHLAEATRRFSELRRTLSGISQKVLTQQLRELEAAGVVQRKVYAEVPPRVEYSLTEFGRTLTPVVTAMVSWGKAHGRRITGMETACARKPLPEAS
jgi:DNA-binding HxlR family transcriptional regulator